MGWNGVKTLYYPCISRNRMEIHSFNAIMPSLQDRGGRVGGIPQGKREEKTVLLSLSKLVCRYVHFLCCFQFLDRNHELLHGFWPLNEAAKEQDQECNGLSLCFRPAHDIKDAHWDTRNSLPDSVPILGLAKCPNDLASLHAVELPFVGQHIPRFRSQKIHLILITYNPSFSSWSVLLICGIDWLALLAATSYSTQLCNLLLGL